MESRVQMSQSLPNKHRPEVNYRSSCSQSLPLDILWLPRSSFRPAEGELADCVLVVGVSWPKLDAALLSVTLLCLFLTFHVLYDSALYSIQLVTSLEQQQGSVASDASGLLLHMLDGSPPSAAVRMLGEILGLQINCIRPENWFKSPVYKKITPMCTIPALQDGDLTICESHAMLIYLTTKYGGEHREKLYPSDFNTRAIINHLMFWETGVLFIRLKVPAMQIMINGLKAPTEQQIADIDEAYSVLEANLSNRLYIATDHLTIADLSLGITATAIQGIHKLDDKRFPLTAQWLARLNEKEYFKNINQNTVFLFSKMISTGLEKNNQ